MAWVNQFLLGLPTNEFAFDVGPQKLNINFARMSSDQRTLSGALRERVIRPMCPTVKMNSSWFPKSQLDLLVSLLSMSNTNQFLSFITRTDWNQLFEVDVAPNTTTVQIQESPASLLSAALVAASGSSIITVTGVWTALTGGGAGLTPVAGSGTNYWTGGSYADATRTINLGNQLSAAGTVYVSYSYTGWLVRLKEIQAPIAGGLVDLFGYDMQLDPA